MYLASQSALDTLLCPSPEICLALIRQEINLMAIPHKGLIAPQSTIDRVKVLPITSWLTLYLLEASIMDNRTVTLRTLIPGDKDDWKLL
ncbi:hypothetical protein [Sodalis-like endosymbiont of Proechinophthirus fluctus]|uniref:hypothetical protein n=1 Tax=Sodalis-like endosymbiont of Proechinophthirus fluctus TaxID=1462730 RepID=UPI001FCBAC7A|nr:hypothetical protein [Sodalis-like endosymbiont of Proechinophthirus fluctus]